MSEPVATVVAVDVGGSGLRLRSHVVAADGSDAAEPGAVCTAPGVRVGSGGIDVRALVADARGLLAPGPAPPDVVVWSMRGLLFLADREDALEVVARGLGAGRTVVVSDAVANLVGALGAVRPGAVVAAGTGAVAFGTDFGEHWNRVDGWGHLLGDAGSAAWMGLAGLRVALREHDGLPGGSARLLGAATAALGAPETWPRLVMTTSDAAERLADVAPLVTAAAADDAVAARICRDAGAALATSLLAAARGLAADDGVVLCATGGLLAATPVAATLDETLAAAGRRRHTALGGALDGAAELGRTLVRSGDLRAHPRYLLRRDRA